MEDEDTQPQQLPRMHLQGGQVTKVIRVGDKVQRPRRSWTQFVHRLLRHLEEVGFEAAPRVLRMDEEFEVLSYIPGEAGYFPLDGSDDVRPPNLWSDEVVVDAATLLSQFHSGQIGLDPLAEPGWNTQHQDVSQKLELICHNDFAPWNCIFHDGRLVGVIDFDSAAPGRAIWDVAYAAYHFVPLKPESRCRLMGWKSTPDYQRRLNAFIDSYREVKVAELLQVLVERIAVIIKLIEKGAAAGDPWAVRGIEEGHLDGYAADIAFIKAFS